MIIDGKAVTLDAGDAVWIAAGAEQSLVTDDDTVIVPIDLGTGARTRPSPRGSSLVLRKVPDAAKALLFAAHVDGFNAIRAQDRERRALREQVRALFFHPMPGALSASALTPSPARSPWMSSTPVLLWCAFGWAIVTIAADAVTPLRDIRLTADQCVIVPSGVVHRTRTGPGGVVLPAVLGPGERDFPEAQLRHLPARIRPEVSHWGIGWASALRPDDWVWGESRLPIGTALTDLDLYPDPEGTPAWRVQRVKRALHNNPGHVATLDNWASRFGVTSQSMRFAFAAHSDLSFSEWRQEIRMQRAMSWLDEGRQAKLASHRLGFSDVSAFSKAFRRHVGMSPRDYQAAGYENMLVREFFQR